MKIVSPNNFKYSSRYNERLSYWLDYCDPLVPYVHGVIVSLLASIFLAWVYIDSFTWLDVIQWAIPAYALPVIVPVAFFAVAAVPKRVEPTTIDVEHTVVLEEDKELF